MPPKPPPFKSRSIQDYFRRADKEDNVPSPQPRTVPNALPQAQPQPSSLPQNDAPARTTAKSPSPAVRPPKLPVDPVSTTPQTSIADNYPPAPSQSSANSGGSFSGGSRRLLSNGQPVVLNSDSETDSDDSEPLPGLDWGLSGSKAKAAKQTTSVESEEREEGKTLPKSPADRSDGKASFSRFVQAAHKSAEVERSIAEAKANLEKPLEDSPPPPFIVNEETLEGVVDDEGDPDKVKRLYLAMQRTNALHAHCAFHFFREDPSSHATKDPFPMKSLSDHPWALNFEGVSRRDHAFLSGFARTVFKYQQLPEELSLWMIDQLCLDQGDLLKARYIELLEDHDILLRSLLEEDRLNSVFEALGANTACLDEEKPIEPSYESPSAATRPLPTSLRPVIKLLQISASKLLPKARVRALHLLFYLCMDDSVLGDVDILITTQAAIEAILCNIPDNTQLSSVLNDLVPSILSRVTHPILQYNIVRSLPTRSPLSAYFQRHLALAFLLFPEELTVPLESPRVLKIIHQHLQKASGFKIDKKTDYLSLAAQFSLLDITIGPGLASVPFLPLTDPEFSTGDSSPITAPAPLSSDERDFNTQVDLLAKHIKIVSNQIKEAGAMSDLARLDAKDCSERLCHRLENAVRIGGRKPNNPFAIDDGEQSRKLLNKWLSRDGTGSAALTGQ
ncbi:hypothetical protein BS50DRAFT_333496 [Corynespora cassiicola Philippines]|uniref:Uncharacterized protein n=1 Tax=Corynespora cassiicola Philippines TaxID=1448308 RepID=A0A2T2NVN7_CORCC|nr:hypothetical protein BS50DRAFT_333496 [Corynespora cassiicola Philippines]